MTAPDDVVEARRAAIQALAEVDRGLDILDAELRRGLFSDARESVAAMRSLVRLADEAARVERRAYRQSQAPPVIDCPDHRPAQHRDGKPPWCSTCGLTAGGLEPVGLLDRRGGLGGGDL